MAIIAAGGVPAALEAHKALGEGSDVLLMEDGLDRAHEVALKGRAARLGRLVLGPGAGHARMHGLALGFGPAVADGPVAIVSASGSAARELQVLLDRMGVGVGACYVVGPNDLREDVGGAGAEEALARLRRDADTEVTILVPWPADERVADRVVSLACDGRPVVVCVFGEEVVVPPGATVVDTLDAAALAAARIAVRQVAPPAAGRPRWVSGGLIRGLYCGAGLCAEAAYLLADRLGQVTSNVRLTNAVPFDASAGARAHACIDLGDPAVRGGAPHPMVDPLVRTRAIEEIAADPRIRVVLLDVVLGYGVHPDPVGALAEPLGTLLRGRPQVSVLAHVVGTERDAQGLAEQERRLAELGVRVLTSNAAAARMAAALVG